MKTFGLVVPRSKGGTFEAEVQRLLVGQAELARMILPMLEAWRSVRSRASALGGSSWPSPGGVRLVSS